VRTPEAFDGIIGAEQFAQAQEILEQRRRKYDPDRMLAQLDTLYRKYGVYRSSLLRLQDDMRRWNVCQTFRLLGPRVPKPVRQTA